LNSSSKVNTSKNNAVVIPCIGSGDNLKDIIREKLNILKDYITGE
jgi:hypothetical protein